MSIKLNAQYTHSGGSLAIQLSNHSVAPQTWASLTKVTGFPSNHVQAEIKSPPHVGTYWHWFGVSVVWSCVVKVLETTTSEVFYQKSINAAANTAVGLKINFDFPDGTPQVTPSYLEELHKLDNYSKAQYVPLKGQLPKGLL